MFTIFCYLELVKIISCMEKALTERFKDLIKFKKSSILDFSKQIGIAQTTLNCQLYSTRGISINVILLTLKTFPEISAEWLLRGEGSMIRETSPVLLSHAGQVQLDEGLLESQHEKIRLLEAENNMLKGENSVLREQVGLGARKADGV
nr:MAG TPA: repressor protein CI [Caudoviricetes sp.]